MSKGPVTAPIFSTDDYIFTATPELGTLYRVKTYRDKSGLLLMDESSRCVFKRVKPEDAEMYAFRKCRRYKVTGSPVEFYLEKYRLFEAVDCEDNRRKGYVLKQRLDKKKEEKCFYFALKKE